MAETLRLKICNKLHRICVKSRVIPGTPNNGTPENGKRDPYHSHIFRDSNMGVGLGNSMGSLP